MSFRPNDIPKRDVAVETVDTSKHALKWLAPPTTGIKSHTNMYRYHSGRTHGELELPETAPLIYPDTGNAEIGRRISEDSKPKDAITDDNGKELKPSNPYSTRKVTQAYFDKRAQAKYVCSTMLSPFFFPTATPNAIPTP